MIVDTGLYYLILNLDVYKENLVIPADYSQVLILNKCALINYFMQEYEYFLL